MYRSRLGRGLARSRIRLASLIGSLFGSTQLATPSIGSETLNRARRQGGRRGLALTLTLASLRASINIVVRTLGGGEGLTIVPLTSAVTLILTLT